MNCPAFALLRLFLLFNVRSTGRSIHRRPNSIIHMPPSQAIQFAQFIVTSQVFHTTKLCAALVNLKPILPGHSLVIPKRVVPRFADLSPDEVQPQVSGFNL